jgi:predicted metalloprotease
MRWKTGRRSTNVEDRRRVRVTRKAAGGGIGIVVIALIAMYFGVDPSIFLSQMGPSSSVSTQQTTRQIPAAENELAEFVSVVLADTEDTWNELFSQMGKTYREPQLVLFSGAVQSACGFAQAAMGPFYCPADQKVYIDLSFYQDLKARHGAPGDFAQAYVIAHEIGHHVQTLLGISEKVHSARSRVGQVEGNRLSVMQELQADCFAGIWAHHANRARQILEEGDIEEALGAASAIGDDRLQRKTRGYVTPDSFTHGSSAQRVRWFKQGLKSGEVLDCNTFRADSL